MKKKVKVSICGMQDQSQEDNVKVVSMGEMYEREEQICVSFEEANDVMPGEEYGITKSLLKIKPNQVEIIRKGPSQTHMVFIKNKDTTSYYSTPYGELEIGIHTDMLEQSHTEQRLEIRLAYALEVNAEHLSNCNVAIQVDCLA